MVAIQIVCAVCGRRTREVVFDGAAPWGEIEVLRQSKGWTRSRPRHTESMRDLCPGCSGDDAARKSVRPTSAWRPGPANGKGGV